MEIIDQFKKNRLKISQNLLNKKIVVVFLTSKYSRYSNFQFLYQLSKYKYACFMNYVIVGVIILTLQFIFQTHGGRQNIDQTYKFYELCFCNLIDEMHHL